MNKIALALMLAFPLAGCGPTGRIKPEEAVSQPKGPAPDFDLERVAGGTLKADEIKGKVTIVDFWATWCQPCIAEIPNFNKIHEHWADKGVEMLGITVESGSLEDIKTKVAELGMKYTVVVGNDKVVEGFGGLIGFPTTFIVNKDWKIYKKYLGMTPNKRALIEKDLEKLLAEDANLSGN